jgi:hypothetical protein
MSKEIRSLMDAAKTGESVCLLSEIGVKVIYTPWNFYDSRFKYQGSVEIIYSGIIRKGLERGNRFSSSQYMPADKWLREHQMEKEEIEIPEENVSNTRECVKWEDQKLNDELSIVGGQVEDNYKNVILYEIPKNIKTTQELLDFVYSLCVE